MILHFKYKKSETFYFAIYAEMNTEGSGTFEIDTDDLARMTYEDMFENEFDLMDYIYEFYDIDSDYYKFEPEELAELYEEYKEACKDYKGT